MIMPIAIARSYDLDTSDRIITGEFHPNFGTTSRSHRLGSACYFDENKGNICGHQPMVVSGFGHKDTYRWRNKDRCYREVVDGQTKLKCTNLVTGAPSSFNTRNNGMLRERPKLTTLEDVYMSRLSKPGGLKIYGRPGQQRWSYGKPAPIKYVTPTMRDWSYDEK